MKKSILKMTGLVVIAAAFCILYMSCDDSGASNGIPDDRAKNFVRTFNRPSSDGVNGGGKDSGNGVTPNHVHTWGDWTVTTAATCSAAGVETRTCTQDASHKETRAVAKLTGAACNSGGGNDSYESVTIGGKKWMKENMNVQTAGSWCYENNADSCAKYGRLYNWSTAKTVCPIGWRLPDTADWNRLVTAAGGSSASKALKSTSGWNSNGNGTDSLGFSALPGGIRYPTVNYVSAGYIGFWWTATDGGSDNAYFRRIYYDDYDVNEGTNLKSMGYSVRCVQDN